MTTLTAQITAIAAMSRNELLIEWRRTFRSPAPDVTPDLLARFITWKLQVKAFGGVPKAITAGLAAIAKGKASADAPTKLEPGARLLREWHGRLICVDVTEEGFRFDERTYRSLTEIASEVTGVHWSGPRFFGLRRKQGSARHGL